MSSEYGVSDVSDKVFSEFSVSGESGMSGKSGVPGESVISKSSVSSMSSEFIVSGQCIVCLMLLMFVCTKLQWLPPPKNWIVDTN